jgi:hypothetical protein
MSTDMLTRLDPMKSWAVPRAIPMLMPEVCPVAGFQCLTPSNILLLRFRLSYLPLPNTYVKAFYPSFALQISTRPNRTPIQNP